jgi:hypothetical protein
VWIGDPDRGFGPSQPGGWIYNILPFMDFKSIHDMGKGLNSDNGTYSQNKIDSIKAREGTPIGLFTCPTRRPAILYPSTKTWGVQNCFVPMVAHTDYAANAGDTLPLENVGGSPGSFAPGFTGWGWDHLGDPCDSNKFTMNGTLFMNSYLRATNVNDGLSHTYLIGEKYLCPDEYKTGEGPGDDWSMYSGAQNDIERICMKDDSHQPARDRAGAGGWSENFGSAHAASFNMMMCDGSVQSVGYDIDPELYRRSANRRDKR